MSRPYFLYALQHIDSQLDRHHSRLREIAEILADAAEIKRAEAVFKKHELKLEDAHKSLRTAETKVKDHRLKIEQNEASLYSGKIRNPKELQDLQNEVAALKRYLETLEEHQLEVMLNLDEIEAKHEIAVKNFEHVQEKAEGLRQKLQAEKSQIEAAVKTLESERQGCLPDIPTSDLALYSRLRQQRAGVAVAKVNERACSACGATMTAALHQATHSPNQITRCETCGRILYAV